MLRGAGKRALHDVTSGRTDHQSARQAKQIRAGVHLKMLPELIGAPYQRNVSRMLVIGLANDTRGSVRRAFVVRFRELLDTEDPLATARQMKNGGAAHSAQAQDNNVEFVAH